MIEFSGGLRVPVTCLSVLEYCNCSAVCRSQAHLSRIPATHAVKRGATKGQLITNDEISPRFKIQDPLRNRRMRTLNPCSSPST